jgi:sugar phosphate isomerase/epimerase
MQTFMISGFADEAAVQLADQVAALQANDMAFVELRAVDGINIGSMTAAKARQVAQVLQAAGIGVSCLGSPIGKTRLDQPFAPVAEMMRRLCENAGLLGTTNIRIFSFYFPEGVTPADGRGEVIDRLGRLLDLAEDAGCTLLHENERDIYGDIRERCLDLHQTLGPRLRGILDPANYLLVGTEPLQAMRDLSPWIDYLHIKDVRLSDRRIVPAGAGDGRIAEILALLAQKPGPHFVSVEPHLTLFAGRDKLEKDTGAAMPTASAEFVYPDGPTAFAAAVTACRKLL